MTVSANDYISEALQKLYPNTPFSIEDEDFSTLVWESETTPPTLSEVQAKAQELFDGRFVAALRLRRNELLAETDWWASSDRTMTAEQTAYRQALRDLPANTTDPENPTWPTKP
tara:strand:+ start:1734 stop:2075 length:342 start_codon:yes stop_codon:yes gene_type:complete